VERLAVLEFGHGRAAPAVTVTRWQDVAGAVGALNLGAPRPAVVVVGGATGLDDGELSGLELLADAIVRASAAAGAVIVDGGTDAGVMRLIGRARAEATVGVPLVGVVVGALAALPGEPVVGSMAALEPWHTHFVLVPGSRWGEEAPWIARVAGAVADGCPSVTVLVNGGEVAWSDVAESVAAGRRVLVVAGTGRTADAIAVVASGESGDVRAAALVGSGLVEVVGPGDGTALSAERRIEGILGGPAPVNRF
jgi:SLOG in TRPM, prokaryote